MTLPQTSSESRLYQMKYTSAFAPAAPLSGQGRTTHTRGITFRRGYNHDCFSQTAESNQADRADVKAGYHLQLFAQSGTIIKEQE